MCEYVEHWSGHLCSRGAGRAPTPTEHGDLECPGNGILGGRCLHTTARRYRRAARGKRAYFGGLYMSGFGQVRVSHTGGCGPTDHANAYWGCGTSRSCWHV